MEIQKLTNSDYRFCLIIWEYEPIGSTALVSLCKERLGWAKPTTYTVLRRLVNRGVLKKENTIVTSTITKGQAQTYITERILQDYFSNSVPELISVISKISQS